MTCLSGPECGLCFSRTDPEPLEEWEDIAHPETEELDFHLALALRRLRIERGLDTGTAGRKLGVSDTTVGCIERHVLRPVTAEYMAWAFNVTVDEVMEPCPRCNYDPPAGFRCLRCGCGGLS